MAKRVQYSKIEIKVVHSLFIELLFLIIFTTLHRISLVLKTGSKFNLEEIKFCIPVYSSTANNLSSLVTSVQWLINIKRTYRSASSDFHFWLHYEISASLCLDL